MVISFSWLPRCLFFVTFDKKNLKPPNLVTTKKGGGSTRNKFFDFSLRERVPISGAAATVKIFLFHFVSPPQFDSISCHSFEIEKPTESLPWKPRRWPSPFPVNGCETSFSLPFLVTYFAAFFAFKKLPYFFADLNLNRRSLIRFSISLPMDSRCIELVKCFDFSRLHWLENLRS